MGGVQYWLTRDIWLQAGVGYSLSSKPFAEKDPGYAFGPAFNAAVGYEFYRGEIFIFGTQLRYLSTNNSNDDVSTTNTLIDGLFDVGFVF